jgi:hypothetical protein
VKQSPKLSAAGCLPLPLPGWPCPPWWGGGQVHAGVGPYRHHQGVGDSGAQQPRHDLDIELPWLSGGLGVAEDLLEGRTVNFQGHGRPQGPAVRPERVERDVHDGQVHVLVGDHEVG